MAEAEPDFRTRYGPWALVVGAGAGLGAAYAAELAARGLDLVLVDRDPAGLDAVAAELAPAPATRLLNIDLASEDAVPRIVDETADLDLGLLVANAASSYVGRFDGQPSSAIASQIQVNVRAPTMLVHALLPRLSSRPRSGVVLMSSQSSRRGAPLVATYAGTKAYLAILAESLWDELRDDGIDVLAVLPGSTRTPGWLGSAPQPGTGTGTVMEASDVVVEALDVLGQGIPSLVSGTANRDAERFMDSLDRAEAVRTVGQVMREMYPPDRTIDPSV